MKIVLSPEVAITLETTTTQSRGHEFSGFGFAEIQDGTTLYVYDVVILHVGSEVYTEINPEKIFELTKREDAANMRVWFHRHPMGNGVPGWHNWSGTDNATIKETPLGGIPELVGWSASIVRTLGGWVGRIDNHKTGKTVHVEVHPKVLPGTFEMTELLLGEYIAKQKAVAVRRVLNRGDIHRGYVNFPTDPLEDDDEEYWDDLLDDLDFYEEDDGSWWLR
jgi:hypothetical protein